MELPRRAADDRYVPAGTYPRLTAEIRSRASKLDWSPLIVSAFDRRTRVMPFRWVDQRVVPCGPRAVATTLLHSGFERTRIVLQQWNPKFLASAAVRAGHRIDLLLVSSMGLHAEQAYRLIRDAHTLGAERPMILIGGPKAIYEPEDAFGLGPEILGGGADVAVTGEDFVLVELLHRLTELAADGEHPLPVFQRARNSGLLDDVPGLVFRPPEENPDRPHLLSTGVQRLMGDLDELPMPLEGYTGIEPPSRFRRTLSARPATLRQVRRRTFLSSQVVTHGCRFNCDFCPIPAYQQRTWRHKSPERVADEMKQLAETMGFRVFFGTDDNFFNDRASVEAILGAMARSDVHGRPFRDSVHFATEATEFDVYKNRDLLPLAHEAGLKTLFFGIEDLNAKLINKGQTVGKTEALFAEMRKHEVAAYAMMIHHDDQPLWSRDEKRLGVVNQALTLFQQGAAGYHTTYITPSMGARNVETMYGSGNVFAGIGGRKVPEAFFDGNHVIATRHPRPWVRQGQLWLAYLAFYNPVNLLRTTFRDLRDKHLRRRWKWQVVGNLMLPISIAKQVPFELSLAFSEIEKHPAVPPRCLPLVDVDSGEAVHWAADTGPLPELVPLAHHIADSPQAEPRRQYRQG